jgi:hypothetical protein
MKHAATHYDNAEVTLNLPLTEGCEGSELYFKEGSTTSVVPMEIGTTTGRGAPPPFLYV